MSEKNRLCIRLTESAVFVRSDGSIRRRNRGQDSRPSMLRGLLILDLAKPTRITSIELELLAKSKVAWPEGIGARRTEVVEEHDIYRAETVYFRAAKVQTRNFSIGPGASYQHVETDFESEDLHELPNTSSNRRGLDHEDYFSPYDSARQPFPRRLSADSSIFQPIPLAHNESLIPPTPPYSPFSSPTQDTPNPLNLAFGNSRSHSTGFTPTSSTFHFPGALPKLPNTDDIVDTGIDSRTISSPEASRSASRTASRPSTPTGINQNPPDDGGRAGSRSRFSLASVSNVLMDVVRPNPPKTTHMPTIIDHVGDFVLGFDDPRGRTESKGRLTPSSSAKTPRVVSKDRSAFSKIGELLRLDHDHAPVENGWKEFKKGTYTYPISFAIPANAPPTVYCNYGSVTWNLKATVHRPGAFKTKYAAHREVIVVSCPTEEDSEGIESIFVERHWEQQLQYLVSISGRSFYIGGTVPISITLLPLAKVKVHRISVFIEEQIDYYTNMKRIARTDPVRYIELLSVREYGKDAGPILPLVSDEPDALKRSPLYTLVSPDDDMSEVASSLMGPGPWTFHQDLHLPTNCSMMHITNKNRNSNLIITHLLKCIIRVERGDDFQVDLKTGHRKQFDIVIQAPVHILSCRCNPEWTSLPRYSETFDDVTNALSKCPCEIQRAEAFKTLPRAVTLEPITSSQSSDSSVSMAETSPVNSRMPSLRQRDTVYDRNARYERLVSGQESEIGEVPPAYDFLHQL